jgi:AAA15 family ATPase/GTPase
MQTDVCKLQTRTFVKYVLDRFRGHIKKHWSEENIDTIEDENKELVHATKNGDAIKKILESHDEKVYFNDAWDSITSEMADGTIRFAKLRQFCGGLATAFPNTCAVESDFSVVK